MLKRAVSLLVIAACLAAGARAQATTSEAVSFDEKLGADDGAALAILIGGNLRGNLGLCG